MSEWNKSDIGSIIIYKSESISGEEPKKEKVAIYDVDSKVPNIVKAIDYPIKLTSKLSIVGLLKSQEQINSENIYNPGDWCLIGKVPSHFMGELERIAKAPKVPLNEDLSSPDTFR